MLADKDRIFPNLYGQGDWHLAGARSRGIPARDEKEFHAAVDRFAPVRRSLLVDRGILFADNLRRFSANQPLLNLVDPKWGY